MNSCKNNPIELYLGTSDEKLYNKEEKKWEWSGPLYWSVICTNEQNIHDSTLPNLDIKNYLTLDQPSSMWDFCNKKCSSSTKYFHIVLTFNPSSKNPNDFLQYVFDIYSNVIDKPRHKIKDNNGEELYIDIQNIDKMKGEPLYEVWIIKSELEQEDKPSVIPIKSPKKKFGLLFWLLLGLFLIIIIAVIVYFVLFRRKTSTPTVNITVRPSSLQNIG